MSFIELSFDYIVRFSCLAFMLLGTGKLVRGASVSGGNPRRHSIAYDWRVGFQQHRNGLHESVSLVPGFEFEVFAAKDSIESERTTLTMKEGEHKLITLMLKPEALPDPSTTIQQF